MNSINVAQAANAILGEGPCWNAGEGILSWVDIPNGQVFEYSPTTGAVREWTVEGAVGAALPAVGGGYVLCTSTGFWHGAVGAEPRLIAPVEADQDDRRMNDAKADPVGRVWAGTISLGLAPGSGALWRLDNGQAEQMADGLTVPNGLDWTPAGDGMWLIDSFAECARLYAYDLDRGLLGAVRAEIPLAAADGFGDGMCVDAAGTLWIVRFGGWAVERYDPDGSLLDTVKLPVSHPTSCAFGGPDLSDLYITTSRSDENGPRPDADLGDQPLAGSMLVTRPGVTGVTPALVSAAVSFNRHEYTRLVGLSS